MSESKNVSEPANSRHWRRERILWTIQEYWRVHAHAPTLDDIAWRCKCSTPTVRYHVKNLIAAGRLIDSGAQLRYLRLVEEC